ncbi:MAG: 3-dehydroquinate synthase family protein [Planctomycetota bacterium]
MDPRTVRVQLGERSYSVHIGDGVLGTVPAEIRQRLGKHPTRAFIVHDTGVPIDFLEELSGLLRGIGLATGSVSITPCEPDKSVGTLERVLAAMGASGHTRADPVVTLGGGIVGDLGGFAAASYQRGVPVVQCPTTVLSMVDASVGGKTGVNLSVRADAQPPRLLKNYVGAFHQPIAVAADTRLLASLPHRHRRSGLAECIKHAMIARGLTGADLISETRSALPGVIAGDTEAATRLIERSVSLKGEVVSRDERETISGTGGVRMLLNLGHTFGHAIETLPGLSPDPADASLAPLHHGEAIALGLIAACRCAEAMERCEPDVGDEVAELIRHAGLPTHVAGLPDANDILGRMGSDKKAAGGDLRLVLPDARGRCGVVTDAPRDAVIAGIESIRARRPDPR